MDCFQILLLLLFAGTCCGTKSACTGTESCCITRQSSTDTESADCGCQMLDVPDTVIAYDQTPPYPFPPYPVLRE